MTDLQPHGARALDPVVRSGMDPPARSLDANSTSGRHTYQTIQVFRFIAAAMVLTTHSTFYASERLKIPNLLWPDGVKGVDLFFVISGFVMYVSGEKLARRSGGWATFLKRRIIRVVPLYWLVTTVKLVALIAAGSFVLHAKLDLTAIVCSYLFLPSYNVDGRLEPLLSVGWTLNFEMLFYLLFAASLAWGKHIATVTIAALVLIALSSFWRPANGPAILFYLNPIVLEFAFGIGIAVLMRYGVKAPYLISLGLIAIGFVLLLLPVLDGMPKVVGCGLPAAFVIFGACSIEEDVDGRLPPVLLFLGAASYSLYLCHPLVAPIAPTVLAKLGLVSPSISVAGSILIALCVASAVFVFIERPISAVLARRLSEHLPKPRASSGAFH